MYFFVLAAVAFLAGIIINGILRNHVNELSRESEEIDHTGFTFFKQMKLKYENCLKMGHEINNIEAFTNKYLDKYKVHGIRLHSFEKASAFAAGLCVMFGVCGALMDKSHVMEYLLTGFLAMYVIAGSRQLIDIPAKRKRITINLVDYFENRFSAAALETEKHVTVKNKSVREREPQVDFPSNPHENVKISFSEEEKKLIDEILREYLG